MLRKSIRDADALVVRQRHQFTVPIVGECGRLRVHRRAGRA